MLRTLIVGLSLSVLVGTAGADVKADLARAKQLYDEGLAHYNLADYDAAITTWKEAYLLSKAPLLLFNLGQAYRLSGDCTKANTFYETYQREQPDPKNKEELAQALELCKTAPIAKPDPTPVIPDKPAPVPVAPVVVAPVIVPVTPPSEPPPSPGSGKRFAGIVIAGGGLLVGAAGTYFAFDARAQSRKLDDYTGDWGTTQDKAEARGERDVKLAWVLGGVGAAAVVTGGILYVLGRSSETTAVSIAPTAGGARVAWSLEF